MLWNIVKDLAPKAKSALPVSLRDGDTVLSDTQDICDSFNNLFANIATEYTNNLPTYRDGCHTVLQDFISSRLAANKQFSIILVSLNFVEKQLQLLDDGKAVGLDWISPKLLHLEASAITTSLTYMFNFSIKSGIYQNICKTAKIIPIHKKAVFRTKETLDHFQSYQQCLRV